MSSRGQTDLQEIRLQGGNVALPHRLACCRVRFLVPLPLRHNTLLVRRVGDNGGGRLRLPPLFLPLQLLFAGRQVVMRQVAEGPLMYRTKEQRMAP